MGTLKKLGVPHNISYRAGLDLRTLVHWAGLNVKDFPREGTHHDALDDCKHQVKYCVAALNKVKEKETLREKK